MIVDYKAFDVSNLKFTKPEKKDKCIRSFAYVVSESGDMEHLFIRTPSCSIKLLPSEGDLTLDVSGATPLIRFLQSVDQFAVNHLFENKEFFFGIKPFTKEHIADALTHTIKSDSQGNPVVYLRLAPGLDVQNQFGTECRLSDIFQSRVGYTDARLVLNVEGLLFTKSTVEIVYSAVQIKAYVIPQLSNFSIAAGQDDDDEDAMTFMARAPVPPPAPPNPPVPPRQRTHAHQHHHTHHHAPRGMRPLRDSKPRTPEPPPPVDPVQPEEVVATVSENPSNAPRPEDEIFGSTANEQQEAADPDAQADASASTRSVTQL